MDSPIAKNAHPSDRAITTFITRADLFWIGTRVGAQHRLLRLLPLIFFCWTQWDRWQGNSRPTSWPEAALALGVDAVVIGGIWAMMAAGIGALTALAATTGSGVLGTHHYEIRDDGFFEATDVNETLTKWSGILRGTRSRSYVLVCENRKHYHAIPIRAFPDAAAADAFLKTIRDRIRRT